MIKQVRRYRVVRSSEALTMWATSSGVDAVRAGLPSATRSGVGCAGPRLRSCTGRMQSIMWCDTMLCGMAPAMDCTFESPSPRLQLWHESCTAPCDRTG